MAIPQCPDLISWNDVEFFLNQLWTNALVKRPEGLLGFVVYPDRLILTLREEEVKEDVETWLGIHFGRRFEREALFLLSLPQQPRSFPVFFEVDEDDQPLHIEALSRFSGLGRMAEAQSTSWLPKPLRSPRIFSFYSFKSGVGRTVSLCAFTRGFSHSFPDRRLLLIDADLEAPGLTSMVQNDPDYPAFPFSVTDFLDLIHADASESKGDALELARYLMESSRIGMEVGENFCEHYFMPAFRLPWQQFAFGVRPDTLTRSKSMRWRLPELLEALGAKLGVEAIVVDLRAGLSEMAGPLFLDPRTRRIMVTSCAKQSVDGINMVLEEMSKLSFACNEHYFDPEVVFTFTTDEFDGKIDHWIERMQQTYLPQKDASLESLERLKFLRSPFEGQMLNVGSWNELNKNLEGSKTAELWIKYWRKYIEIPSAPALGDAEAKRRKLADMSHAFAETNDPERFLGTEPLRRLARHYRDRTPIAVVAGAKGSGKTFTSLAMAASGEWSQFVAKATNETVSSSSPILVYPFLHSSNLSDQNRMLLRKNKEHVVNVLDVGGRAEELTVLTDHLEAFLKRDDMDLKSWREAWFVLFAKSLGVAVAPEKAEEHLLSLLRKAGKRIVFIIDGLEDIFGKASEDSRHAEAIRALIERVPNRLKEIPDCPLGLVVFIRSDLVRAAIIQNAGQFEDASTFKLEWDRRECLRLVYWVCLEAKIFEASSDSDRLQHLSEAKLEELLQPLWGRKLGSDRSNEAYSARWIIAALSDFKLQIQARDLIRLLHFAAKDGQEYSGRLLAPKAIRDAVQQCSREKVREIKVEFYELKPIFDKLDRLPDDQRFSPFKPQEIGLEVKELKILESLGILMEENGDFYLPEIYLHGLRFTYSRRGRSRVLSLFRKNGG